MNMHGGMTSKGVSNVWAIQQRQASHDRINDEAAARMADLAALIALIEDGQRFRKLQAIGESRLPRNFGIKAWHLLSIDQFRKAVDSF